MTAIRIPCRFSVRRRKCFITEIIFMVAILRILLALLSWSPRPRRGCLSSSRCLRAGLMYKLAMRNRADPTIAHHHWTRKPICSSWPPRRSTGLK
jgi:hypothetical protein